jgi:hypothetical protein
MDRPLPNRGKGKAKAAVDLQSTASSNDSQSLASKVLASASGLARNIAGPANVELSSLVSSSAQAGKNVAVGSLSSKVPLTESLESRYASSSNSHSLDSQGHEKNGFRSHAEETSIADEFKDFAAEDSGENIYNGDNAVHDGMEWASEFRGETPGQKTVRFDSQGPHSLPDYSYVDDGYDDGAEVRHLLSDPNFVAITDVYDTNDPTTESAADLFHEDFSEREQQAATKMKASLPQAPVHNKIQAENHLNLRPNFEIDSPGTIIGFARQGDNEMHFTSSARRELWLSEWNDVLNGYTDEVWGELLPEVQQAKRQIEDIRTGSGSLDTKAIARLKMILGHVGDQLGAMQRADQAMPLVQSRSSAQAPSEDEWDTSIREFHCPRISCHERFHNMQDLRRHSATHKQYSCSHANCNESFLEQTAWAKHIEIAHHDLLDTGNDANIGDDDLWRF